MLSSIGVNPLSLAGQMVSFLILFFVFRKFLFGPILENLDKRAKKQKEAMKAAEETVRIRDEIKQKEEKMQKKLQKQVQEELEKAQQEANKRKEALITAAKKEAEQAASREYSVFAKKLQQKEKEVKERLSELVVLTTKKVLSENLAKTDNKKIVSQQIKKLKQVKIS